MVSTKPVEVVQPAVGVADERRLLLSRVLQSNAFAKSERLSTFLSCVCDLALSGRSSEINEHKIGTLLFGRTTNYDSSVDGIVRTQASRLRQRLDLYFNDEGSAEPVRIILPRGCYVPVFKSAGISSPARGMEQGEEISVSPAQPAPEGVSPSAVFSIARWLPWALSLTFACMFLVYWASHRLHTQQIATPFHQPHPLWDQIFLKGQSTIVVAPDSGLVLFHGMSGQKVDLKDYLDAGYRSEVNASPQIGSGASRRDFLLDLANRRYTSVVDLKTILSLKDKALLSGGDLSMRYARDLRPNDLKTGNVILLGASEADPWIELYETSKSFVLSDDYRGTFTIINRHPDKGEPSRWESKRNDPQRRVYGVVTYKANFTGSGNALLLEGTGMSGAEAGMDFVLDDTRLLLFLRQIQRADGSLPHFELLLETHNIGASAVQSQVLAWRKTD